MPSMNPLRQIPVLLGLSCLLLSGCDMLGIDTPEKVAAVKEADGKAIGGACRHAGRAIEDCYTLNRKADKAAVFAGWREMNDYMRENKLDAIAPQLTPLGAPVAAKADASDAAADNDTPAPKAGGKSAKTHQS